MQIIAAARMAPISAPATTPPSESAKGNKQTKRLFDVLKSSNTAKSHGNLVQESLAERRDWIQRILSRRVAKESQESESSVLGWALLPPFSLAAPYPNKFSVYA